MVKSSNKNDYSSSFYYYDDHDGLCCTTCHQRIECYFNKKGTCNNTSCDFAHPLHPEEETDLCDCLFQYVPLCTNFKKKGKCVGGDKCAFRHSDEAADEVEAMRLANLTTGATPTSKEFLHFTKECEYFKNGTCGRGDKCTYLHTTTSNGTPSKGSAASSTSTSSSTPNGSTKGWTTKLTDVPKSQSASETSSAKPKLTLRTDSLNTESKPPGSNSGVAPKTPTSATTTATTTTTTTTSAAVTPATPKPVTVVNEVVADANVNVNAQPAAVEKPIKTSSPSPLESLNQIPSPLPTTTATTTASVVTTDLPINSNLIVGAPPPGFIVPTPQQVNNQLLSFSMFSTTPQSALPMSPLPGTSQLFATPIKAPGGMDNMPPAVQPSPSAANGVSSPILQASSASKPYSEWSTYDVMVWLAEIGMPPVVSQAFAIQEIDGRTLDKIDPADYPDLGLTTIFRKKTFESERATLASKKIDQLNQVLNNLGGLYIGK
ncbi:hypothetical protein SAMD00019534_007200 [Acytostelium subglobosum LB1]|uniref:hypothetical protein n=1 Tax=Acytostelium subglobosum LB1 TaxID=1410327 RepID=UPI0006450D2B|nr:hypothetical protein SAMD00019534_007200 [Acytostelium subglobosum LB1]GAM17545.1 hypothetical protein SAMD00019534_007200 [Acytostelium subglobosum LB1]|eukprot:XP_012759607.1 hypothetical protein SAMD00019534_007200 [Acytostelium subglobosum LB1]